MSAAVSQQAPDVLPVEESDSDSGKGSCDLSPPVPTGGAPAMAESSEDQDSDGEVAVKRKPRGRTALSDSDSEAEEGGGPAEALALSESSEEERQEGGGGRTGQRTRRVAQAAWDSEDSEAETDRQAGKAQGESPAGETVKREERSEHCREKDKRRAEAAPRAKRNRRKEEPTAPPSFNDSGCLLRDSDLFDTGVGEEEEESLDAIRAAMKNKVKKHKERAGREKEEAEGVCQPERKERKAARASKEAMKQLHSESQRLVRESSLGLPYHLPEPKSIDQFFRRKARPTGPAMALLKSANYQPRISEGPTTPQPAQNQLKPDQTVQDLTSSQVIPTQAESEPAAAAEHHSEVVLDPKESQASVDPPSAALNQNKDSPDYGLADNPGLTLMECSHGEALPSVAQGKQAVLEQDQNPDAPARAAQPGSKRGEQQEEAGEQPQGASLVPSSSPLPVGEQEGRGLRKDKLARLRELGLDPPPKPRLCADEGAFVCLEPPAVNSALEALKERFLRHAQPVSRPRGEHALQLGILRKDRAPSGHEELVTDTLTVTVTEGEEEVVHTKPGEKLVLLKSRLQQAMAQRRLEERQRRAALQKLDNEDCEEEEEEEEMTDESEGEGEGVESLLGREEEGEEGVEGGDAPAQRSCSPPPDPLATEGTLLLFAGSSCSRTGEQTVDGLRRAGPAGLEGDSKLEDDDSLSLPKDSSHNSSFELVGSMIPSYQPVGRATARGVTAGAFRSPSPGLYRPGCLSSTSKSSGNPSFSLSLPVEDSQDLYAEPGPCALGTGDSQGRFSLEEDTHSQLLDADGFLNVGPRGAGQGQYQNQNHKRQLILDSLDENAMDANMGELLGLCSGTFKLQPVTNEGSLRGAPEARGLSSQDENMGELLGLCSGSFATQDSATRGGSAAERQSIPAQAQCGGASEEDVDELLALCSGKFTSPDPSPAEKSPGPAPHTVPEPGVRGDHQQQEEEEDREEEDSEFHLLSDVGSLSSDKEESEREEECEEEEEDEEALVQRGSKRKLRLAEFLEEEAELSGSEVDSEDEYEEAEGSEYEEDELQEELPSDEELQDQVNRIHMKQVLDDDKRRLRLYQERYLADGDLHSDGPGRIRRFRWRNIDETIAAGLMGGEDEGEEEEEELDEAEMQRRKDRLERELWLQEQAKSSSRAGEEEEEDIGEGNQFMRLAKKLTAKKLQQKEAPVVPAKEKQVSVETPFQRPAPPSLMKRGSLLNQPKAVLQKLASISDLNPNAPRNSRGFLFQTLSPEKAAGDRGRPLTKVKRGQAEAPLPDAKRPCRDSPARPQRSIFRYLES
ncbi:claspin isoform X1 [Lepisosteus oculatus]|uniref:claspin isoform X1 n=2 Tax=Lepisosteus oculatus TaxID=7918 RepID=UPI0035F51B6A